MIKLELNNNPGYPTTNPEYYGTIHHSRFGVTGYGVSASVNCDYRSTLKVRRYLCGLEPSNFPVPAISRVEINERGVYLYDVDVELTSFYGPRYAWRIKR